MSDFGLHMFGCVCLCICVYNAARKTKQKIYYTLGLMLLLLAGPQQWMKTYVLAARPYSSFLSLYFVLFFFSSLIYMYLVRTKGNWMQPLDPDAFRRHIKMATHKHAHAHTAHSFKARTGKSGGICAPKTTPESINETHKKKYDRATEMRIVFGFSFGYIHINRTAMRWIW